MKIGVPKETAANERRVAVTPDVAGRLVKTGLSVLVEGGAGEAASFGDDAYGAAGATLAATAGEAFGQSDVVLKVQLPSAQEAGLCREGGALVALFQPSAEREAVTQLAARKVTAFSLALLPRITRAQPMDVLSSQATVAGYKAVLLAATATGRFFPMLVTAAGTLPPARVLVLGAGVAGLQAIATARRLGAAVRGMKPGSVIVDLAVETGGNCELTEAGTDVVRHGVLILGPLNLPSTLPYHASQMYARNVASFLMHVARDGKLVVDLGDEIIRDTCVTYAGEVRKA